MFGASGGRWVISLHPGNIRLRHLYQQDNEVNSGTYLCEVGGLNALFFCNAGVSHNVFVVHMLEQQECSNGHNEMEGDMERTH